MAGGAGVRDALNSGRDLHNITALALRQEDLFDYPSIPDLTITILIESCKIDAQLVLFVASKFVGVA